MVSDRDGVLDYPIVAPDGPIQEVRLEFVPVQPGLAQVDRGVVEDRRPEDSKPVGGIGDPVQDQQAEHEGVEPRADASAADWADHVAAPHPARALDVIDVPGEGEVQGANQVRGLVLVVPCKQGQVRSASLATAFEAGSDRRPDTPAVLVAQHDGSPVSPRLVPRAVARAVVHDNRFETTVGRPLVQDATDLAGFVESRQDDRDERLPGPIGGACWSEIV